MYFFHAIQSQQMHGGRNDLSPLLHRVHAPGQQAVADLIIYCIGQELMFGVLKDQGDPVGEILHRPFVSGFTKELQSFRFEV